MLNRYSLLIITLVSFMYSQQSLSVRPYSFGNGLERQEIPVEVLPELNIDLLFEEDNQPGVKPFRYGYRHEINLNTANSGVWDILENGDAIWRLKIESKEAYHLSIVFSDFNLPDGSMLHVYKESGGEFFGGYSSFNNSDYFSTPLIEGDYCIIEYFEPYGVDFNVNVQIDRVVHDYRNFYDILSGDRDECGTNVVCPEADPYEDEINASAHLDMGGYMCSGAMINNTAQDLTPYFLTADHCVWGENVSTFRFYFKYATSSCSGTWASMGNYAYGSQLKWTSNGFNGNDITTGNDLALLEIIDNTASDLIAIEGVYYAGWNKNSGSTQSASVGVHHPNGEPKQISFTSGSAYTSNFNSTPWGTHWKVYWNEGGTEGGSSGSPLFDGSGRILGPLTGGPQVNCGSSQDHGLYGKLNYSWSSIDQWLDPINSGVSFLSGTYNSIQLGCTDSAAENYDPSATQDDGSCEYASAGEAYIGFGSVSGNTVDLVLNNSVPVSGCQLVVSDSPDIVSLVGAEGGAAEDAGFSTSINEDGTILSFSFNGSTISPGTATLLTLTFSGLGPTELCLSDAVITDSEADALSPSYGNCIMYAGGMAGDLNGDNTVNIQDIVIMVNIVLGSVDPTEAQELTADINDDGSVNIQDIIIVINIILGN